MFASLARHFAFPPLSRLYLFIFWLETRFVLSLFFLLHYHINRRRTLSDYTKDLFMEKSKPSYKLYLNSPQSNALFISPFKVDFPADENLIYK
jgi:hypothetical protein